MNIDPALWHSFDLTPETAGTLTDGQLAQLLSVHFKNPANTNPANLQRLVAEALVRCWLYENRCPAELVNALSTQTLSKEFQVAFRTRLLPLRRSFDNSDAEYITALEVPVEVPAEERVVWNFLRQRLLDFLTCDGLIALVPPVAHGKGDGVAVPFRLNRSGKFRDLRSDLQAWSDDFSSLREDYQLALGADVLASFPPGHEPGGGSFGLPLMLARERAWAVDVPEFGPLDVLASGEIRNGALVEVGGVEAKQDLARRLGCGVFLCPGAARSKVAEPLTVGLHYRELLPKIGERLRQLTAASPVRRALQQCQRVVSSTDSRPEDYSGAFRRLSNLASRLSAQEAGPGQIALTKTAKQLGVPSYHTLNREMEGLLAAYRARAFHGRDWSLGGLQSFLQSAGGLRLIIGKSGYGKTALMTRLLDRLPADRAVFRHFFSQERSATRPLAGFYDSLGLFLAGLLRDPIAKGPFTRDDVICAWDELRVSRVLERTKVVLILDGLDEAEEPLEPPFVETIPEGVHVFAAMRSADTDRAESYVEKWRDFDPQPLTVDALGDGTIRQWLETEDAALRHLSINDTFRKLLRQRTGGCPRFIADMLGVLARVPNLPQSWETELRRLPDDYKKFVQEQYRELKKDRDFTDSVDVFLGLLCAAEDELNEQELRDLLGNIPKLTWRCERWVAESGGTDGQGKRYVLQTSLLKEALREELAWQRQQQQLVAYCQRWPAHGSPYALRHYGTHLARLGKWAEVTRLVLSVVYREKVRAVFPDEPDLPLHVLRSTLALAIEQDNWEGIAELMLAHAEFRRRAMQYREDRTSEETASIMAKLVAQSDPAQATLWRLLQAWCVIWQKNSAAAEPLRVELASCKRARLNGLEADIAADLLVRVFDAADERLDRVAVALLDEEARSRMVEWLAKRRSDDAFLAARRVLKTMRPSRRNDPNRYFDWAMDTLAEELAQAGRWREIEPLTADLLPRQRTVTLLKVGGVAAQQKDAAKLANLRNLVAQIADSCIPAAKLAQQGRTSQDLHPRQGNPADRFVCRSNQARLDALRAQVAPTSEALELLRSAFSLAQSLVVQGTATRPQFHALTTIVQTVALRPELNPKSSSRHPVRRYLARLIRCWRGLLQNDHDSLSVVVHDLVTLMDLAATVRKTAPEAWPNVGWSLRRWNAKLKRIANWLPARERDDLWLHFVRNTVEADVLASGRAVAAIKRISNDDKRSRAMSGLVERLCRDGLMQSAYDIGEKHQGLQHHVRLAVGLATLDYRPADAARQLVVRLLPNSYRLATYPVQRAVLLGEAAASLAKTDRRRSLRCLRKAEEIVGDFKSRPANRVRFALNVAEAANRSGNPLICREVLGAAVTLVLDTATSLLDAVKDEEDEGKLPETGEILEAVETLCAVAVSQQQFGSKSPHTDPSGEAPWERTLGFAHGLATRVPGLSNRTEALAEVAEAKRKTRQSQEALNLFHGMRKFAERMETLFGQGRTRRQRVACLGEIVLGLVKVGFFKEAAETEKELPPLFPRKHEQHEQLREDSALRAFAILRTRNQKLGDAIPLLRRIQDGDTRMRAARDMAICLAKQGRWKPALAIVTSHIERPEFKRKTIHKVIAAVSASTSLKPLERQLASKELLWPCSESFDSAYVTLAHLVRHRPQAAPPVATVLDRWHLISDPTSS